MAARLLPEPPTTGSGSSSNGTDGTVQVDVLDDQSLNFDPSFRFCGARGRIVGATLIDKMRQLAAADYHWIPSNGCRVSHIQYKLDGVSVCL